ncbi:MAG: fumarate hydratase [Sphaerochaetaceae bacterium]|nr:fumarate hydratase [Sphaerochaetaceae bacterium]NLO60908.1 fumarate hydratase [Spirochaetales bacterium]MDD2405351.1 fumarate hydratase [Sphaerochaetaceae bacterium]MDD3670291.1 fumarate hydratase [Sphaerochaetaceae bacterium]MDD4258289.1 fumarate hydratase [Sphaerochaetaceae bacterium]
MIRIEDIRERVKDGLLSISTGLEPSLVERLQKALDQERRQLDDVASNCKRSNAINASIAALEAIMENLDISASTGLPMCQDTGMIWACVEIGPDCPVSIDQIQKGLEAGISDAVCQGHFRLSVVDDPLFNRTNTKTNLPAVVHWMANREKLLSIHLMLKGFGCENCSSVRMLNPTSNEQDVIDAVKDIMKTAGGKPCPPVVLGIGIGGTMDQAALNSKYALCRQVGQHHKDKSYAKLELDILEAVQTLNIGAAGFGGSVTALWTAIEYTPTHIAGLPVAVSVSCWADRNITIEFGGTDGLAH